MAFNTICILMNSMYISSLVFILKLYSCMFCQYLNLNFQNPFLSTCSFLFQQMATLFLYLFRLKTVEFSLTSFFYEILLTASHFSYWYPHLGHHHIIKPHSAALGFKWGKGAWDFNIQDVFFT